MKLTSRLITLCRFLERNKLYSFINIIGFSVSLAFVMLIGLYIQQEKSVDQYHTNKERVYRIEHNDGTGFPAPLAQDLKNRYPEIEMTTRIQSKNYWVTATVGESSSQQGLLVDPTFFRMFSFPLVEGSLESIMNTPYDIVVSASYARQLYGNVSAMGKQLKIDSSYYVISGVVTDLAHSHLRNYPIFIPFESLRTRTPDNQLLIESHQVWGTSIYVMAYRGADLSDKIQDINHYAETELELWTKNEKGIYKLSFNPLENIYLSEGRHPQNYFQYNEPNFLRVMAITAFLILIFAGINYLNLSVAQAGFRAKSAAIQRLLGSNRGSLFRNFIFESVSICILSLIIGCFWVAIACPWFNELLDTNLSLEQGITWGNLIALLVLTAVLGIISGWIPATVISGFKPIDVVRGTFRRKTKMTYSKVLIAFQYTITIVLIACTITIIRQVNYMKKSDLGFDTDNLITCRYQGVFSKQDQNTIRDVLATIPGVQQISFSQGYPTTGGNEYIFEDSKGTTHNITSYKADSLFLSILNLQILHRTRSEYSQFVWLNETAWQKLGLEDDAIDYQSGTGVSFPVKGKVKNFHFADFSHPIGAVMIQPLSESEVPSHILIKINSNDPYAVMERIRKVYNEYAGGNVFNGQFLTQSIESLYQNQNRLSQMLGLLTFLSVVISTMGMLAMAIYFTRQRNQEMAVRKVFGAYPHEVLRLLLSNFLGMVAIAFVIAVPFSYYFMKEWLTNYTYRISLSASIWILAGSIVFCVAFLTVFGQALKSALSNPIKSLKSE